MKADENPLAQNELGRQLTTWGERIEPHTNKILGGILIAVVLAVAFAVWRRSGSANATKAWTEYYECQTVGDFETFLEDYPSSPATSWARLEAARQRMVEGYRTSLSNRSDSLKALRKSKEHYEALLQEEAPPEIRERGLAGLAMVNEALCDGDVKPAEAAYSKLLQEFPETYYKRWAEARLEALKKPDTAAFYAWYAKQDPKPADRPAPRDGRPLIPGSESLPKLDDLFNPEMMKEKKPAGEGLEIPAIDGKAPPAKPAAKGDEKPGSDAGKTEPAPPAKPATESPAAEKPAGEKPSDEPKKDEAKKEAPAVEEKPAAEKKPESAGTEKPAESPK